MKKAVYDLIGVDYNQTRSADPFLVERLSASLLPAAAGGKCLDIGCGTGNYTVALASQGRSFFGVEPSATMLREARRKAAAVWVQAAAEELPFTEKAFAGAVATLTIHHWQNLEKSCAEIYRVLRKAGNFVIFTSFPEQMEGYWLNHYFPTMLEDSRRVMPRREKIEAALKNAGFVIEAVEKYFVRPDLRDLFLYSGKDRPALYFDPRVRKGISSFSALSRETEVASGLKRLAEDLENGNFAEVSQKYANDLGDYCFIVAGKP